MSRPTKLVIKPRALLHNLDIVKNHAPGKQIIAMIKANAYGCGIDIVAPTLEGRVDAFGVACLEEALVLHTMGIRTPAVIFQGIFHPSELPIAAQHHFQLVIHQAQQVQWLVNTPLLSPIKLWVKVNTGMNRLGFKPEELPGVMSSLQSCPWVDQHIGLMSHLACADEPNRIENSKQITLFKDIPFLGFEQHSLANSAAIIALPQTHAEVVRPGIMLYGVSPFSNKTAPELGLEPVMHFMSAISAIHHVPAGSQVGYQGIWCTDKASVIGIVAAGYGDGYPRHLTMPTWVGIDGHKVPIVGRISMDTMAVDLTTHPDVSIGDTVELWGNHIFIEHIAQSSGTSAYELLCQTSSRPRI
ncbi:MAG: alanine racemase [Legionella sp.]|nr:alanine racemase [Legionella sp.]